MALSTHKLRHAKGGFFREHGLTIALLLLFFGSLVGQVVDALIALSIYLRERGSSQSKRVAAPHYETGE